MAESTTRSKSSNNIQNNWDNFQLSQLLNISVIETEILWLFKFAEEDWSFASCDHLNKLFARMFKGCNVAETLGVGHTKTSYFGWHRFGPVVRYELIKDISNSGNIFTLLLDENYKKKSCQTNGLSGKILV